MKILCRHGYGNTKWWLGLREQKMLFHEDSVLQLFYKIEFVFLVLLHFRHPQLLKDCGAMPYRLLNIIFQSFLLTFSFPLDLGPNNIH